jgi:hypothetical protein
VHREFHTGEQLLIETRQDSFDTSSKPAASRTLRVRYVYRYEMQHLLELSGFKVEALYGEFDGRPFDNASEETVWLARKA